MCFSYFMYPPDTQKSSFSMGDEFIDLVDNLHKSVCVSALVSCVVCAFVLRLIYQSPGFQFEKEFIFSVNTLYVCVFVGGAVR